MARIPLISAAYAGKSVISSGQECVNLYAEIVGKIDPQAPTPITYYPTPGTILKAQTPNNAPIRGCYRTSAGTAYIVSGINVYYVAPDYSLILVGNIADKPTQVYFKDNGIVVVLVDGSNGYVIDMSSNQFAQITDPNFYGSDFVELLDTFFIFNNPGTNQFYISASNADFGMLTNTGILFGTISNAGYGYVNGSYSNVNLTGGSGTEAQANITVGGTGVRTGAITTPGTLYTTGVYLNVPLTGGGGAGAIADITVAAGAVTAVSNIRPGTGYTIGNTLSASAADIGGTGSGFVFTVNTLGGVVTTLDIVNPGKNYAIGNILSASNVDLGGTGQNFAYTLTDMQSAFDPLDIAAKSGFNDPIVAIISVHRELWLVGNLTTEVWIGTGAADFYFQQVQGAYINHGCGAPYSIASQDTLVFFIQQDMQGNGLVLQGQGYDVTEISTPRIVEEFKSYANLSDAIGFCFQIADHAFYALAFPSASKGWLYDLTTKMWSEWNWTDENGNLLRPRANCCMFAFGVILVGDYQYGKLLQLSVDVFTDEGNPIIRIRTFPHLVDEDRYARIVYNSFDADMQVGDILDLEADPQIYLSWSDNKGVTYGNPVAQSLGKTGEYLTTISWNRLGMARDRVFKLQWSTNNDTALNGGFITRKRAAT